MMLLDPTPAPGTIDECQGDLHGRGWSAGDMAVATSAGTVWIVFARRDEQRVVAKATSQVAAWREAVRVAVAV